jgi:hypothetical protein
MTADGREAPPGPAPERAEYRLRPDHLVINVKYQMSRFERLFQGLGFALTPQSVHSLGSVNRLAVFAASYLELVGLPPGGENPRKDILESHTGIDGLVFAMDDPGAVQARLVEKGFAVQAVRRFSRPVEIDGVRQLAEFETVRLAPGQFKEGRVYFCRHLTPHLVWREEWMRHPNTVRELRGLTIVSSNPERTARRYAALGDPVFPVSIVGVGEAVERFGMPALPVDRFAAVTMRCEDPGVVAGLTKQLGRAHIRRDDALLVPLEELDAVLEFTA